MAEIETQIREPIRPDIVGESLNYVLIKRDPYKEYTRIEQDNVATIKKIRDLIVQVYSEYFRIDISYDKYITTKHLRGGDIIIGEGNSKLGAEGPVYLVTFVDKDINFTTWPRLSVKDPANIKGLGLRDYKVIRPNLSDLGNSAIESIRDIAKEAVESDQVVSSKLSGDDFTVEIAKNEKVRDSILQIGDITFIVDPTNISFTTQNGYQFFPTVRTQGNPKIPTIDQIKNISISLIFPNEDSINYQLLNLIAMLKRAPFVNIRNRDICSFFSEIVSGGSEWPYQWLSVALESIHVQSIDGFPNTVQAQVTILPFYSNQLVPGLQALRSMKDVSIQQALMYNTEDVDQLIRVAESKMDEQSVLSSRFLDVVGQVVNKDLDFRRSIPFRAYYQSIINDRNFITDEYGSAVAAKGENLENNEQYPIAKFRPQRPENRLHYYKAQDNYQLIAFNYSYIPGNFHEISKLTSKEREKQQEKIIQNLTNLKSVLETPQDVLREVVTSFHTIEDAFDQISMRWKRANRLIPELLARQGITLDSEYQGTDEKPPIKGLFDLLIHGALQRFGIEQSWNFIKDGREFIEGKFDADNTDYLGLLKGLVYYGTDRGLDNDGSVTTAQNFINQISNWLNDTSLGEQRKEKFAAFLTNLRGELFSEYTLLEGDKKNKLQVIVDPTGASDSPFRVSRISIEPDTIEIDNITDVITAWSIVFSNKYIPITLQAFKYPYYQHIGFEDPAVSIQVKSLEGSNLKEKLSLLSERLYESNKILHLTAPELINSLDGRMTVDCSIHHMFRAFGVHKVVYNSSNITSDPKNPNCWNSNISFTQANFTIEQYHKIEHVPTNNTIKNELAKLLARIDIKREGEGDKGKIIVRAYKQRADSNDIEAPDSNNNDTSQLEDINEIETIVRLRFLLSRHGDTLSKHIKRINALAREQARRRSRREQIAAYSISGVEVADERVAPIESEEVAVDLSKEISYLKGITSDYEGQMEKVLNKSLYVYTDREATNALQELFLQYPFFEKIIRFVVNRFDNVMETQTKALINLIQLDTRTWLEAFLGVDQDLVDAGVLPPGGKVAATGALAALAFATKSVVGKFASKALGYVGIAVTIFQAADSAVETKLRHARRSLVEQFDGFFLGIIDNFNTSALQNLGSQIYRDPVIRNKFLKSGIITQNSADVLRDQESKLVVNCYNDFDIPPLPDDGYSLSPDFYIFNRLADRTEADAFVEEAMKRHARIGKLTSLMTLQENMDVLDKFESILNQTTNPGSGDDQKVLKGTTSVLLDGKVANSVDEAKTNIDQVRRNLESQFVQISRATKSIDDGVLSDERLEELKTLYIQSNPEPPLNDKRHKEWLEEFNNFKKKLSIGKRDVNLDQRKLNLLYSARVQALLKIFERYVALNQYMEKEIDGKAALKQIASEISVANEGRGSVIDRVINRKKGDLNFLTKTGSDIKAAKELYAQLSYVLENASNLTSQYLVNPKDEQGKILKNKLRKGVPNTVDDKYVSLPAIRNLQSSLYNDIAFYIRLNTYLTNFAEFGGRVTLDALPELKMLDYWNFQQRDSISRRNEILKEFWKSYKVSNHSTIKMFPTFKLYFIEEDKGIWRSSEDYYSHNAIQSIEIVSSKSAAGKTAIVRLSNVTNTLTNRLSFHREAEDILFRNNGKAKDAFFGTLDVKPATPVMIKMGYAPNDRYLDTLFVGRIIEMNAGPIVELVCQSYGAQLNHHIVAEQFGLLATNVKEHGDVASALLDTIPGLEKLGKLPMFGLLTGDFSGQNLRNVRGSVGDRYLLGNLLGSVTALTFAQDNPRDENIYLPYSMVPELIHRPTFDWIVYDQSVWEALEEISLYTRNVRPMLKIYNNEGISFKNDIRETLFLGDKSGYYKYTDALSLSTLNIREIDRAREKWRNIKQAVNRLIDIAPEDVSVARDFVYNFLFREPGEGTKESLGDIYLNNDSEYKIREIWEYMQDRTSALLLIASVLDKVPIVENTSLNIESLITNFFDASALGNDHGLARFVNNLLRFSNMTNFTKSEISGIIGSRSQGGLSDQAEAFKETIRGLIDLQKTYSDDLLEISSESYYNVKSQISNTSDEVASDPRYKRVQEHHLVTDIKDIISNNIALNSSFANAVHLYYTGEPSIKNASIDDVRDGIVNRSINLWEMKAFGDTKDEHLRILNSYQKNIDTNWWDISTSTHRFFQGYNRIHLDNGDIPTEKAQDYFNGLAGFGKRDSKDNLDVPRWDLFPSFVVVALGLLIRQVEKMYQGTIELVGNPKINPHDIIHLEDYTNDMHGAIEVEEVIHTFTPDGGFRTIVTPNLITYDRDPMKMQDVAIINNMAQFANDSANASIAVSAAAGVATALSWIGGPVVGIPVSLATAPVLYNNTIGAFSKHHKFMYDQLGNAIGRDCINFTSLIYHGIPYMAGFDGVDYTSLKTMINHKVQDIKSPIARLAAFSDPLGASISTNFSPGEYGAVPALLNYLLPGKVFGKGLPKNSNIGNFLGTL